MIAFAGKLITFTIGIRFLTDFLSGDVYFRVHRPAHNLDRARTQFRLVESIERNEAAIRHTKQDARQFAVGPVRDTAIDAAGGARLTPRHRGVRIVLPKFATGAGIQRDDFRIWGSDEHGAADHDRSAFNGRAVSAAGIAGVISPGDL